MERVQSLINKLTSQAQSGASVAELLATTELLQNELLSYSKKDPINLRETVAVWLPAGYKPVHNQSARVPAPASSEYFETQKANPGHELITEQKVETLQAKEEKTVQEPQVSQRVPPPPVPPSRITEVPDTQPLTAFSQLQNEEEEDEDHLLFQLHQHKEEPEEVPLISPQPRQGIADVPPSVETTDIPGPGISDQAKKNEPVVQKTSPEPEKVQPNPAKPFPEYPDAATLMKRIFPLSSTPMPPKREVNELVVDPSIPLNEKLHEKRVELSEVLAAGPKITDLRKAISINDKYQMIQSLFRNDEDMFERSIRTLNNFGSLPEARFWMQRELVTKLGWNEKNELAQYFYKLVSRRFA